MAHRKRESAGSGMLDHRVRPGPVPHSQEPESEDMELPLEGCVPEGLELAALRPESPTPEEQECHNHSPDGDSSSDYVNNTSEEEDYDEGLPEEEEGITYYIRYCPEDDSYLEGMDCNGEEYLAHGAHPVDTDECQEAVEEWTDSAGPHPHGHEAEGSQDYPDGQLPIPEDEPSVLEAHDQEEDCHYCPSKEGYQDYYPEEANGNTGASPYRLRRGDGDLEDQEEDIDQIVAEIKMSLSMTSITSASEASPEHGPEPGPGDSAEACPPVKASCSPSRHEARPKSLNLPPEAKHPGDPQRGFKPKTRTPEERPKWLPEQVCNGLEQPRKQQRSDLNGPVDNNNIPETKKVASFPSFVAVPGPCEPEDLIDGIIFAANYLGSTQLLSERNPSKNIRMMQAQEAVSRVKNSEGDAQTLTEVDLFISTQRIKVLNADTQETMMDHALRTISYIADIGNIVVLMARRRMPRSASQDCIETTPGAQEGKKQYKMICHVFESEDLEQGPLEGLRVHPAPSPATAPVEEAAGSRCRMPVSSRPALCAGPAHRPVHRPGLQRGLPGVPASQWHQPRRPEPEGVQRYHQHPGDVQRRPHPLLQLGELQGAAAGEAQGRDPGCGGGGVRLGLHPAHGDPGQHDEWRPGCPLREAEHRGPDHVHQWHQPGGAAARHLPRHHQGPEEPDTGEAQHRQLSPGHHGPHQAARPQVPAGLQRAEWHYLQPHERGYCRARGRPRWPPHHRDQRAERGGHSPREDSPSSVQLGRRDPHEDHARRHVQAPHGPGDPAVHLGPPAWPRSLDTRQGHPGPEELGAGPQI
ncbi:amyloid-beta A4 precursor protein-binding family A member 2 isoform X2 [Chlorocebus sabaeus]|uniref:amyloid-beta A4 precursor protein-binding family A member 2 isoform X2 n=1 Tax=Chlorocebus sabaeus TaxID=60711 RepID=UPI003BF9BA02